MVFNKQLLLAPPPLSFNWKAIYNQNLIKFWIRSMSFGPLNLRLTGLFRGITIPRFFHLSTLVRRKRNRITIIKNRVRKWLLEEKDIANYTQKGFKDIYSTSQTFSSRLVSPSSQWQAILPNEVCDSLGCMVSVEEIKAALWSMKAFKAPGPDSFYARFFQCFQLIIGDSIVKEIQKIFKDKMVPKFLNRTHIAFIPKV